MSTYFGEKSGTMAKGIEVAFYCSYEPFRTVLVMSIVYVNLALNATHQTDISDFQSLV